MKLLSICIPTFNRINYLKELLPELIKQCKPYPEIEILITDNHSDDGTKEYIKDISNNNSQVRCVYNDINIGGDKNFIRCVELANGKYVWLYGDDDVLCKDAIKNVLPYVKSERACLIIVSGREGKDNCWEGTYKNFIKEHSPQIIINHTLITSNIFLKDIFNGEVAISYIKDLHGSYSHIYAMYDKLKLGGLVIHINKSIFTVRPVRAKFIISVSFIRLKWIKLLYDFDVSYIKILYFVWLSIIYPIILRQYKKVFK